MVTLNWVMHLKDVFLLSPQVGFEPTTNRLTADRSTPELLRIFLTSKLQCTDLVQVNNLDGSFKIITKRLKTNKCVFDH